MVTPPSMFPLHSKSLYLTSSELLATPQQFVDSLRFYIT